MKSPSYVRPHAFRTLLCVLRSHALSLRSLNCPPQEEMAAASLDQNFTEELSAIEQCELRKKTAFLRHQSRLTLLPAWSRIPRVPRALRG